MIDLKFIKKLETNVDISIKHIVQIEKSKKELEKIGWDVVFDISHKGISI